MNLDNPDFASDGSDSLDLDSFGNLDKKVAVAHNHIVAAQESPVSSVVHIGPCIYMWLSAHDAHGVLHCDNCPNRYSPPKLNL